MSVFDGSFGDHVLDGYVDQDLNRVTLPGTILPIAKKEEYTGSSVSYYRVNVNDPTSGGLPYIAECNDIIEALGMNYAEGNAFKALWRRCAARNLGLSKRGYEDGLYDAEKVEFFGKRLVVQEKAERAKQEPLHDSLADRISRKEQA